MGPARFLYIILITFVAESAASQTRENEFITSDSVHLYLRVAGKGLPCLFLHGGPGNTSFYFEGLPVADSLQQHIRMIYFDQRGSGRSGSPGNGDYSMKRMEKDLEEIRTWLHIEQWSVIGHSFGGLIMTAYAADYPKRVRSLIYVHCATDLQSVLNSHIGKGMALLKEKGISYRKDSTLSDFKQMMNIHTLLAKEGIEYKIMFRSQKQKELEDSLIGVSAEHFNQDFSHFVWAGNNEYWMDYGHLTRQITCPVLVIAGTKDYAVGPDAYKSWRFTNSKLALYNGGHVSFQEEPRWFTHKVLAFLQ